MAGHTPTPWRTFTTPTGLKLVGVGGQDGGGVLDAGFGVWAWDDAEGIANAALVVRAVNNHESLLAVVTALAEASQPEATSRLREMAKTALKGVA